MNSKDIQPQNLRTPLIKSPAALLKRLDSLRLASIAAFQTLPEVGIKSIKPKVFEFGSENVQIVRREKNCILPKILLYYLYLYFTRGRRRGCGCGGGNCAGIICWGQLFSLKRRAAVKSAVLMGDTIRYRCSIAGKNCRSPSAHRKGQADNNPVAHETTGHDFRTVFLQLKLTQALWRWTTVSNWDLHKEPNEKCISHIPYFLIPKTSVEKRGWLAMRLKLIRSKIVFSPLQVC